MSNDVFFNSGQKLVANITGGGIGFLHELTRYGGASKFLVEATINYSKESTDKLLGGSPDHYVSKATACQLAVQALMRGIELQPENAENMIGLGATSSLFTKGQRKERKNHVHIAIHSLWKCEYFYIDYIPGLSNVDRWSQELDTQTNIFDTLRSFLREKGKEPKDVAHLPFKMVYLKKDDLLPDEYDYVFPGAFNPIHSGHEKIIAELAPKKVAIEFCVFNFDKPPIDYISLQDRIRRVLDCHLENFSGYAITRHRLFADKIKIFKPRTKFIIGADTLERVIDRKYYHNKYHFEESMNELDGKFIVFPRKGYKINKSVINIDVIDSYEDCGISSTKLRKEQNA